MPDDDPRDVGVGDDDDGDGDDDKPPQNQQARGRNQGGNRGQGRGTRNKREVPSWQKKKSALLRDVDSVATTMPALLPIVGRFFNEGADDSWIEQLARISGRDSMKVVAIWIVDTQIMPRQYLVDLFTAVDARLLTYPLRVLLGMAIRAWAPENELAWELSDELIQEIQQRLAAIRSGEIIVAGAATTPVKKAEAQRKQAVAFLVLFPLIEQRITRLFTVPAERLAVKTRVRDALDTEDEAKYLARPVPPAFLPFIGLVFNADGTRTALGQKWLVLRTKLFKYDLAQYEPVEEQLQQRIESAPQLEALVAGNPPLEVFTQRLNRLPETDGMEKTQFEEDLLFIEDSKGTSRVRDFFKGVIREIKKVDHIVPNEINDGASALADEIDNLANSLFGAL